MTIKKYNKKPMIDIRELYESNGQLNFTKKGITLNKELWESLKKNIPFID